MKVYISGISGTGMGPLALMAKGAHVDVVGSDLARGAVYDELAKAGISVHIGEQDGEFLRSELDGLDWFVYTSAVTEGHPELEDAKWWKMTKNPNLKITKRDDFTAFLVERLGLKMVAVAGTHGKTTTTAMIVWACLKLGLPVSYIVGTTLGFAPSGFYAEGARYFVYEADEYDRNFLKYNPWLGVVTSVSYDHPDIYATREEYAEAFLRFKSQCAGTIEWTDGGVQMRNMNVTRPMQNDFRLAGEVRRKDAVIAAMAVNWMMMDAGRETQMEEIIEVINEFPGVGRRFEKLSDGVYTDYAHHPEEIAATVAVALEQAQMDGLKGVVVVYQPHQNARQLEVREWYKDAFLGAKKVYFLPTYLVRGEKEAARRGELVALSPEELVSGLANREVAEVAELSDELYEEMMRRRDEGYLVLLLSAGPADEWLRGKLGV